MGFTGYAAILYLILLVLDIFAFKKGRKISKWTPFIAINAIMVIGIIVSGYLWFTSPM